MSAQLALRDVSVSFSGFRAVDGLDLAVAKGELHCLIGPNGAGKTTCLDLVCGKIKPSAGRIEFGGRDLAAMEEYQIARAGVGRKFQVPSVFKELSVRENLEVAHCRQTGVLANLRRFGRSAERDDLDELARFVGLHDCLDLPAGFLSHGQTQWLELAMLLAQDAELILLDEPTAGMTAQETLKTAEILQHLKGRHTLVVVEHDMGFIKEIAEIISVMHLGKLLAQGTVGQIEQNAKVREAYLGSARFGHA